MLPRDIRYYPESQVLLQSLQLGVYASIRLRVWLGRMYAATIHPAQNTPRRQSLNTAYIPESPLESDVYCAAAHSQRVATILYHNRRTTREVEVWQNSGSGPSRPVHVEDKLLKSSVRKVSVWVLLLAMFSVSGSLSHAQSPVSSVPVPTSLADRLPDPRFDAVFTKANGYIADQEISKAYDEFVTVNKDAIGQNVPLAADALLRAVLLAYNTLASGPMPGFDKLPLEAQEARRDKETDVARKAHDVLKQIKDDPKLADSQVGQYVTEPHWPNIEKGGELTNLKTAIESQIDHRNSRLLQYQVVDKLVHITGANPNFSYWFALILIAIVVKTITFPLTLRTYKSQREMQKYQPQMKELQERYKGKPELNEKMMAFYKEHKINPFASCVPMLVQLPFMYYVYNTIRLYEYHFSHGKFLWIGSQISHHFPAYLASDLAKFDMPLLVIYALSNYLTMKLNPAPDPSQAQQQKTTSIMMTVMFFWMFMKYQWSAAFIFYWLILNFISAFQQYTYIFKPNRIKPTGGSVEIVTKSIGGVQIAEPRTVTPIPGGTTARPRPKARKRK